MGCNLHDGNSQNKLFWQIPDNMGYNMYDNWYTRKSTPCIYTRISKQVWICTDINTHGNIDMDNDLSNDAENRL